MKPEKQPYDLLQAVDAVLREALDAVDVHPCDEHNDEIRARGLTGPMRGLHTARMTHQNTCFQADVIGDRQQVVDIALHHSKQRVDKRKMVDGHYVAQYQFLLADGRTAFIDCALIDTTNESS